MRVAACLVTRGDVPLDDIVESIPEHWEIVVWDNSKRDDLAVYGRYAAIELTDAEFIYVQDDDCVLTPEAFETLELLAIHGTLVANMPDRFRPHYPDSCLIGFGSIFERDLPRMAFAKADGNIVTTTFNLACDVYFTALTKTMLVDLPYRDQPWASASNRMWKRKNHVGERNRALVAARRAR